MKTGDRVVCVKSHSMGYVKKGETFYILAMDKCKCGMISFDVGIVAYIIGCICPCGIQYIDGVAWIGASLFAPIQTKSEFISSSEFIHIEETIDIPIHEEA